MSNLLRTLFTPNSSRHKKLNEDNGGNDGDLLKKDGTYFYCKCLGSTMVADAKNEQATATAIRHIIIRAKQSGQKPSKVVLGVSLKGIAVFSSDLQDVLLNTSIYKISYCSADAHYDHVFAFIATNDKDELECHAFLCAKKKIAQDVTKAIAGCFNLAAHEFSKKKRDGTVDLEDKNESDTDEEYSTGSPNSSPNHCPSELDSEFSTSGYSSGTPQPLIDFDESSKDGSLPRAMNDISKNWAQFDDADDFDEMFARLEVDCKSDQDLQKFTLKSLTEEIPKQPTNTNKSLFSSELPSDLFCPPQNQSFDALRELSNLSEQTPNSWNKISTSTNSGLLNGCQSPTETNIFNLSSNTNPNSSDTSFSPFGACNGKSSQIMNAANINPPPGTKIDWNTANGQVMNSFNQDTITPNTDWLAGNTAPNSVNLDLFNGQNETTQQNLFTPQMPNNSNGVHNKFSDFGATNKSTLNPLDQLNLFSSTTKKTPTKEDFSFNQQKNSQTGLFFDNNPSHFTNSKPSLASFPNSDVFSDNPQFSAQNKENKMNSLNTQNGGNLINPMSPVSKSETFNPFSNALKSPTNIPGMTNGSPLQVPSSNGSDGRHQGTSWQSFADDGTNKPPNSPSTNGCGNKSLWSDLLDNTQNNLICS